MAIPLSALRRALAEMAEGSARGVGNAFSDSHIGRGYAYGGLTGMVPGGIAGAMMEAPEGETYIGPGVVGGMLGGMALGTVGGGGAKLAHMVIDGARGGGLGFSRGLREALAEQAASRGMGRRAVREAADGADASAFQRAMAGPRSAVHEMDVSYSPQRIRAVLKSMFPESANEIDALTGDEAIEAARRVGISIADEGRF